MNKKEQDINREKLANLTRKDVGSYLHRHDK